MVEPSPTSLSVGFGLTGVPLYSSSSDFAGLCSDFVQRRARRTFSTPSCQCSTNLQKFSPPLPLGGLAACCSFLSASPCTRPHGGSSHSTYPTTLVQHHGEMILPAPRGFATSSSSIFFQERRSAVVTAGQDVAWKPHILHALTHGSSCGIMLLHFVLYDSVVAGQGGAQTFLQVDYRGAERTAVTSSNLNPPYSTHH